MLNSNKHSIKTIIAAVGMIACTNLAALAQDGEPAATTDISPNSPTSFGDSTISFGAFSEAMELTTLIDYVGSSLNINIVVKGSPTGEVVFNAPVRIPRNKLIDLLDAMLEQYAFTISTSQIFSSTSFNPSPMSANLRHRASLHTHHSTPNIKPSLLINALNATLEPPAARSPPRSKPSMNSGC